MKALILTFATLLSLGPTMALAQDNVPFFIGDQDAYILEGGFEFGPLNACGDVNSAYVGSGVLPDSVPEPYNSIFTEAADVYGIDVATLATIFYVENRGWVEPPPPYGTGDPWPVSRANAQGPFQFLPGTWANYATDGNGDGVEDINDLTDAAYGAADFVRVLGGTAGIPLGHLEDDHFRFKDNESGALNTVARVFKSYNAGSASWREPSDGLWYQPSGVWDSRKQGEINHYITLGTETYAEIMADAVVGGEADGQCQSPYGTEGSIGVGVDGFVFPLATTQQVIKEGSTWDDGRVSVWCYDSLTNCHHNYNAADIFAETGVPVVASKPGEVVRVVPNEDSGVGSRVTIKGIDDPNTETVEERIVYYYTHMGPGTIPVSLGDTVTAGQKIGEVGTNQQAVGTARHLHFDMLPPTYTQRVSCSGADCKAYPFISVQPFLVPAYDNLNPGGAGGGGGAF